MAWGEGAEEEEEEEEEDENPLHVFFYKNRVYKNINPRFAENLRTS